MSKDEINALIEKLNEITEGEMIVFTKQEAQALREVASLWTKDADTLNQMLIWWQRWVGAFAVGGLVGRFAKWFLLFVAFIAAVRAGLIDWITSGGGGS